MEGCNRRMETWIRESRNRSEECYLKVRHKIKKAGRERKGHAGWNEKKCMNMRRQQETAKDGNCNEGRWKEWREMDERKQDWLKGGVQGFWLMGIVKHTHTFAHTHSQALGDALKLNSLAPEGVVSAVASSRSHHLGPPVPQYRVGWRKRGGNTKTAERDSYICMANFQIVVLLTQQPL